MTNGGGIDSFHSIGRRRPKKIRHSRSRSSRNPQHASGHLQKFHEPFPKMQRIRTATMIAPLPGDRKFFVQQQQQQQQKGIKTAKNPSSTLFLFLGHVAQYRRDPSDHGQHLSISGIVISTAINRIGRDGFHPDGSHKFLTAFAVDWIVRPLSANSRRRNGNQSAIDFGRAKTVANAFSPVNRLSVGVSASSVGFPFFFFGARFRLNPFDERRSWR